MTWRPIPAAAALVAAAFVTSLPSHAVPPEAREGDGYVGVVWQSLSPGAGGAIQDVVADPNTPGRLFLASDMEGHYRSDDFGRTWQYVGSDVRSSYVNTVAVQPGNPDRVLVGTTFGLDLSDDAGKRYRAVELPDWKRDSIGVISFSPHDPQVVVALPGEGHRFHPGPGLQQSDVDAGRAPGNVGDRDVYLSDDAGQTWRVVKYKSSEGRRDGLTAVFHPDRENLLMLGTAAGVYLSDDGGDSFTELPQPPRTGDNLGAIFGPDGEWVYATYQVPTPDGRPAVVREGTGNGVGDSGVSHLFAAKLADLQAGRAAWTDLNETGTVWPAELRSMNRLNLMKPVLDPVRSDRDRHVLLASFYRPQRGLWQASVDTTGNRPRAQWQRVMWYDIDPAVDRAATPFDIGWEKWGIMAHNITVAPETWGERAGEIFATSSQTLHVTDPDDPRWADAWEPRYTRVVRTVPMDDPPFGGDSVAFYRTRGQHSEFVFDASAWGDYVIQSAADNCIHESFDGGYSWTNDLKPPPRITSRSNASLVLPPHGDVPPIALAHVAVGWGAAAETGELWAKRLDTMSVEDEWVKIGGGPDHLAGLPYLLYNQIIADPHDPGAVYIGTFGRGVWRIDDVAALIDAAETVRDLPEATGMTLYFKGPKPNLIPSETNSLRADPIEPDVVWCTDQEPGNLWRGEADESADGGWRWQVIRDVGRSHQRGAQRQLAVADVGGRTVLFTGSLGDKPRLLVSGDGGRRFVPIAGFDDVRDLLDRPVWFEDDMPLELRGVTAKPTDEGGVEVYFAYVSTIGDGRRGYGMFAVTLDDQLDRVGIRDLTADFPWPYPVRAKVIDRDGAGAAFEPELYVPTRGNGLWRRPVDDADPSER
jgi:hypothetical protein